MRNWLTPGWRHIAAGLLCVLTGCQPAVAPRIAIAEPVPVNGVGYIILNGPIVPLSRDLMLADMDKLRFGGATEIDIGMNSPGGSIDAAQEIVDYMRRVHDQNGVTFRIYNIGIVASAATYIFLNAQSRYTAPNSAFLFHAAGMVSTGMVNAQNLRDTADKLDAYERTVRATLKARTHLTDAETLTYVRRTVVLSPDDARRDGVVDAIAAFTPPKGARTWLIASRPPAPGTAVPRPAVTTNTPG